MPNADCYLYLDFAGNVFESVNISRQAGTAITAAGGYLGSYAQTPLNYPTSSQETSLVTPYSYKAWDKYVRRLKGIDERTQGTGAGRYSWFDSSYNSYNNSATNFAAGGTSFLIGQNAVIFKVDQTFSSGTSVTLGFGIYRTTTWTGSSSMRIKAGIWKVTSAGVATQLYNDYINSTNYRLISNPYFTSVLGTFTLTGSATLTAQTDVLVLELGLVDVNQGAGNNIGINIGGGGTYGTGGGSTITTDNSAIGGTSTYFQPNSFIKFSLPQTIPTVTLDPVSTTVTEGTAATFTSYGYGIPNGTVQWQVSTNGGSSWSNVSGATANIYTFTTSLGQNAYQYRAVFTNSAGSANSSAVTLTVNANPPVITANPSNSTVAAGATASFTASATGSTSVQWLVSTNGGFNFYNISGATSTTYSFTTSSADNGYQYIAAFTNSGGTTYTSAATLTILSPPSITGNPSNATVIAGNTVSFSASASGGPTPSVQWQVSTNGGSTFGNISGATSTTYSFTSASGDNAKVYRAVFTNSQGSATTSNATLTVYTIPSITGNPSSTTVVSGSTASFSVSATGNPSPSVQWQISTNSGGSWSNISGATSTTYTTGTTINGDSGTQYRAAFTNAAGTTYTSSATLTVNYAPSITGNPASSTVINGSTASFTASATGNPSPSVQWQYSTDNGSTWNNVVGATSTTYSFTAADSNDGYQYRAIFTNSVSTATTTAATLAILYANTLTKLANPTLPVSNSRGITFHPSGTFMAVSQISSPYIVLYSVTGNTFTKLTDPTTPSGYSLGSISFYG